MSVTVQLGLVLRRFDESPLGIDLNYLRDAPALRPEGSRPLAGAFAELRVHWLRYPGGEKANAFFFGPPPFDHSAPVTFGAYATMRREAVLDFDAYMELVQAQHAVPYIVTGYDTLARKGKTKSEYLAHAVGWVRYANVTHHYRVKYWEIGNENWNHKGLSAADMAGVLREFVHAMKAVDPTIKVGTNALNRAWAQTLVDKAGGDLDFISYSNYFGSEQGAGYGRYLTAAGIDLIPHAHELLDVIEHSPYRGRIEVIAAEFGAGDFSKSKPMSQRWEGNDLGHALVLFDMVGQFLCEPGVTTAMFWTTRWMDDANPVRRCYALGYHNEILPVGEPLALWGRCLHPQMVTTSRLSDASTFASYDPKTGQLTFAVVNKGPNRRTIAVKIEGAAAAQVSEAGYYAGTGPEDRNPRWASLRGVTSAGATARNITLAPFSITILELATAVTQAAPSSK